MDHRLRSKGEKKLFSGFTTTEMEKMDRILKESGQLPNSEVIKKLTTNFNRSAGRAGKPLLKWTEVQNWFLDRQKGLMSNDTSLTVPNNSPPAQEACALKNMNETSDMSKGIFLSPKITDLPFIVIKYIVGNIDFSPQCYPIFSVLRAILYILTNSLLNFVFILGRIKHYLSMDLVYYMQEISATERVRDPSKLEFEAKSSDDAWYDVETFITYRFITSSGHEVLVRYAGYGEEEDEWVHVKNVRERSVPFEHSECNKVMVGNTVLCFQEKTDQARHYDAQVVDIQRKLHDIRGCRCIFLIRYEHDNSEEAVRLKRLCCRPEYLKPF